MRVRIKTVNSGIALSPELFAKWCKLADATGKSRNTVIGELIAGAQLAIQAPTLHAKKSREHKEAASE